MKLFKRSKQKLIDNFYDDNLGKILPITCCKCGEWRVGKITCECGKTVIDIAIDSDGEPVIMPHH